MMNLSDIEIEAMGQSLGFQVLDDGGTWLVKRKLPEGSYLSWVCYSLPEAEQLVRDTLKTLYPNHRWSNWQGRVREEPDTYYNQPVPPPVASEEIVAMANALVLAIKGV